MPLNSANRFAHVDALRCFAVLVVVVAHAGLGEYIPGGSGVTVFFSISGFIITLLLLKEREKTAGFSWKGFYWRRFFKIAPPFLIVILIPSIVRVFAHPEAVWPLLSQVFFIYNWTIIGGEAHALPGSGVVWSLSIEEQFYIVFALVWIFMHRSKHWIKLVVVTSVVLVAYGNVARILFAGDSDRIYYGSDTRFDGIALGMLAAAGYFWWVQQGSPTNVFSRVFGNPAVVYASVLIFVASLIIREEFFRDTLRYTLQSASTCGVILFGLVQPFGATARFMLRMSQWMLVEIIGLASYSIYLVHLILMSWLSPHLHDWPAFARIPAMVAIGVGAGVVLYMAVEKPALRLRKRIERRFRSPSK
ncbi:acyltransferase family protein [Microbacterium gubbeenense]|uniref:acyltransferase family protein n=1 Tax=Microbacterium gubbeenense TaxID=159896 RepID=UPI00146A3497|nr:acyltransferase [Microbacterium gubbeenense]